MNRNRINYQVNLMKFEKRNTHTCCTWGLTNRPSYIAPQISGRSTGTTNGRKLQLVQKKSKVVAVIAVEYNNIEKSSHAKLWGHTLSNLIESKIEESGIREEYPDYTIPKNTLLSCLKTGNLIKSTKGISLPLQSM